MTRPKRANETIRSGGPLRWAASLLSLLRQPSPLGSSIPIHIRTFCRPERAQPAYTTRKNAWKYGPIRAQITC